MNPRSPWGYRPRARQIIKIRLTPAGISLPVLWYTLYPEGIQNSSVTRFAFSRVVVLRPSPIILSRAGEVMQAQVLVPVRPYSPHNL